MSMTQPQLLASIGAKALLGDQLSLWAGVEHGASATRISGEVVRGTSADPVTARIMYRGPELPSPGCICGFRAEPKNGVYTVVWFKLGSVAYIEKGQQLSIFSEADACAFVRAVMLELQAGRLPDLDELLTIN